ncbi:MAG: PAS domain S-box protein [Phycisphaerales bacterium JB061]
MQNIIDQLSSATAGFDQTTWAVVGGAAFVVMLMGLVLGMVLRKPRAKKPVGADKPGVLGACGAATFACRVTPDLRVTELSADIEILTGYTAETLTNADAFVRMLDEGDAQMFESRARNAVQEEHSLVADLRYEDADGRRRWMTVRAEPTKDNRGRVTGLHGVVREITDQKRLATDAAAAWARFHALANSTTTMLWVLNEHGDCQATNSASERFAGATEDHIRGTGWAKSFPEDEYQAVIKFVGRAFDERTNLKRDSVMIDGQGRTRYVSLSASPARDQQGEVSGIVLVGKDITDRSEVDKQLERLRRIVDASEQNIAVLAPDMRVTLLNTASRELIGLGEREAADNLALWHVVTKDTSDQIRSEGVKACAENEIWQGRGRLRMGEDDSVSSEFLLTPLGDGWHGLIGRPIEHELQREADAAMDRRRLAVALGALERLSHGGWAPGRAAQRIVESVAKHYTHLRTTYATFADDGTITAVASDGPAWMGSAEGRTLKIDPDGALFGRLRSDEIVKIEDVWDEGEFENSLLGFEETATRSIAAVLVDAGDRTAGLMLLEKPVAGKWTHDEAQTLRLASGVLGVALRSERDRRARMTAEARIAEQTQRWRDERYRSEELSTLAADRAGEAERLEAKLEKVDSAWAGGLAELGKRAIGAADLAGQAREAGLGSLAEGLERLATDADRAEVAGRIVSGTLRPVFESCEPAAVLRHVGERFVGKAKARGVTLKINQEGELPQSIEADSRLMKLACCELLEVALTRCSTRDMVAVVSVRGDQPDESLVVSVAGGPISTPSDEPMGAPAGLSLLRQLCQTLGGRLETVNDSGKTELSVVIPIAREATLKVSTEEVENDTDQSREDAA